MLYIINYQLILHPYTSMTVIETLNARSSFHHDGGPTVILPAPSLNHRHPPVGVDFSVFNNYRIFMTLFCLNHYLMRRLLIGSLMRSDEKQHVGTNFSLAEN